MIALVVAALYTSTAQVESIAAAGAILWAATGGGVEEYSLPDGTRRRLYTTQDGLDSNHVRKVSFDGVLHARTESCECTLRETRFLCLPAPLLPEAVPAVSRRWHGERETDRLNVGPQTIVATAGGLFLGERRITPPGQICGNHIEALAEFRGELWAGAFDGGVCVRRGGAWHPVRAPFRMVNDLRATPRGLYAAAAEGLFVSRDGRRFRREARVRERGANRLASSKRWLFVTTPSVLYAIGLDRDIVRRWRHPAGSTALQSVTVSRGEVWLASEDRGVIRKRGGKFESFDRASGLPSSWTVDVAPTRQGGVWAASLRDGAFRLSRGGSVRESSADPNAWGLRLYDDGGRMLFGTQQGLQGARTPALPDPHVHALLRTREALWIGTEGGLLSVDEPAQL